MRKVPYTAGKQRKMLAVREEDQVGYANAGVV